jgi:hypothetical protein
LYLQLARDPAEFSSTAFDISTRPRTAASVAWVDSGIGAAWQNSPDLSVPLQELVDAYQVESIALLLIPNTDYNALLSSYTYAADPAKAPKLVIEYKQPAKWNFFTWA